MPQGLQVQVTTTASLSNAPARDGAGAEHDVVHGGPTVQSVAVNAHAPEVHVHVADPAQPSPRLPPPPGQSQPEPEPV